MDVFEYIATASPAACQDLCAQYGYQPQAATTAELGDCMSILVQNEGEPALRDLMSLHPDKDVILEQFGSPAKSGGCGAGGCGGKCRCASCSGKKAGASSDMLSQLTGQGHALVQTHQAGLFIIGGLLVLTLAIISSKS